MTKEIDVSSDFVVALLTLLYMDTAKIKSKEDIELVFNNFKIKIINLIDEEIEPLKNAYRKMYHE